MVLFIHRFRYYSVFIVICLIFILASCSTGSAKVDDSQLVSLLDMKPVPDLTPEEVVEIQLTAFKVNDTEDQGIALAYRFASPRNKKIMGTVENFASLVRQENFAPMLYNAEFELGPVDKEGEIAMVAVRIKLSDGNSAGYIFILTRQDGGEFNDCWMTDGVMQVNTNQVQLIQVPATIDS